MRPASQLGKRDAHFCLVETGLREFDIGEVFLAPRMLQDLRLNAGVAVEEGHAQDLAVGPLLVADQGELLANKPGEPAASGPAVILLGIGRHSLCTLWLVAPGPQPVEWGCTDGDTNSGTA